MTPTRLGAVASALIQGDSIKAACHSALVPETTYKRWMTRGEAAIIEARAELDDPDIEGRLWEWIESLGGFGSCDARAPYWTTPPPRWWPRSLHDQWLMTVFVVVVSYARARSEQVYRATITRAAQGGAGQPPDWKAAQFMLTHSFGWRSAERLEVTGADGGPIDMQAGEAQVLAALAALAEKRRTITVQEDRDAEG